MPKAKGGKKGRKVGRQFRNETHKRYNRLHGYASKSNPRRKDKKWSPRGSRPGGATLRGPFRRNAIAA